eukprot:PITA_07888
MQVPELKEIKEEVMDTILRLHNGLHSFNSFQVRSRDTHKHSHHSVFPRLFRLRKCGSSSSVLFSSRKTACVVKARSSLLELVPEAKKESLEFELPEYDSSKQLPVDLVVVGGGPAGLAVAQQVSEAGISVCCIDPSPQSIWPNNYGVWVDEFEAMDLLDCLDTTWGFSRCLVEYDKPYDPGYQVAYGILAEVDGHPFDVDKMVFMDCRDSHLSNEAVLRSNNKKIPTFLYAMPFSPTRIFLEETSLVARPGVSVEEIQKRMVARLKHLGIQVKSIEEDEICVTPMGGPLPEIPQRILRIGGTAGMVHPSTGYMLARTLAAAPVLASSIVKCLGSGKRITGDELSAKVWKDLWPMDRRRQREFFCFGMDILLKLDLEGTRRFFNVFFDLEPYYWHGFLSSRLFLPDLAVFGLAFFAHASNTSRIEIMTKGTLPLLKMINTLMRERE